MPKTNIYHLTLNKNGTWDITKKGDKQPAARLIPMKNGTGKRMGDGDTVLGGHLEILKRYGTIVADFDSILDSLKKKISIYNDDERKSLNNTYQVKPHLRKGWIVIKHGNKKPYKMFETKKDAIARAKELAKRNLPGTVEICKLDWTLQSVQSYPIEITVH
jgi:hypothetical protein